MKQDLERLKEFTKECSEDMVINKKKYKGESLDCERMYFNLDELPEVILVLEDSDEDIDIDMEIDLATLIALARKAKLD